MVAGIRLQERGYADCLAEALRHCGASRRPPGQFGVEAGCMNASMNVVSRHALHSTRIMVNGFRDETARHFQKQGLDTSAMTPEANTNVFQAMLPTAETTLIAERFRLRTGLSKYNGELQAKLLSVDVAQQNSYVVLQVIVADTATEQNSVRDLTMNLNSFTNDANVKVTAKFHKMDAALGKLKKPCQISGSGKSGTSKLPSTSARLKASVHRPSLRKVRVGWQSDPGDGRIWTIRRPTAPG